jgi:hypothetical protein
MLTADEYAKRDGGLWVGGIYDGDDLVLADDLRYLDACGFVVF